MATATENLRKELLLSLFPHSFFTIIITMRLRPLITNLLPSLQLSRRGKITD